MLLRLWVPLANMVHMFAPTGLLHATLLPNISRGTIDPIRRVPTNLGRQYVQ